MSATHGRNWLRLSSTLASQFLILFYAVIDPRLKVLATDGMMIGSDL
jgi:hypothetical protein